MAVLPHDITDLRLAPVTLAVDAAIEDLGRLSVDDLANRIERYRNISDITRENRMHWIIQEIEARAETFEWTLSFDDRGIRLTHKEHSFVLGTPATINAYIESRSSAHA